MTLISVESEGGDIGRCDARCYNAREEKCTCCCGGKNHGLGYDGAVERTAKYRDTIEAEYKVEHPGEVVRFHPVELELFGGMGQ